MKARMGRHSALIELALTARDREDMLQVSTFAFSICIALLASLPRCSSGLTAPASAAPAPAWSPGSLASVLPGPGAFLRLGLALRCALRLLTICEKSQVRQYTFEQATDIMT